jgi:Sulfotransferase domain
MSLTEGEIAGIPNRARLEPLCKFLDKEVPDEPYPRVNEGNNSAKLHFTIIYISYAKIDVAGAGWGGGYASELRC